MQLELADLEQLIEPNLRRLLRTSASRRNNRHQRRLERNRGENTAVEWTLMSPNNRVERILARS